MRELLFDCFQSANDIRVLSLLAGQDVESGIAYYAGCIVNVVSGSQPSRFEFHWVTCHRRTGLISCARLRIGAFNLRYRSDFDLRLSLVKFDCASNPDHFPLERGDLLVGRNF
jgi:hypothetical protein